MGYAFGTRWSDDLIESTLNDVVKKAKLTTFPTHAQMTEITGSTALTGAVSRYGGTHYWADRLGLEIKPCESKMGEEYELKCMAFIKSLGYGCEKTPPRYPYDLLVENNIKVDVKSGNLYKGEQSEYYTFNLEKPMPTCDIFVCNCLEGSEIKKTYVIPSSVLTGKTQLSIGKIKSKYDPYLTAWDVLKTYDKFYQRLGV